MPPLVPKARHAILLTLGRRIAARRKARWLWQRDIATTLGVTPPYISQVEKGRTGVSYLTVVHIARALGTSAAWLASPAADEPQDTGRRPVLRKPWRRKKMSAKVKRAKRAVRARLGDEVRRRRLAKGLTLRELAARANLSVPHLSAIERGLRGPRPKMVARIAKALRVTVAELAD